MGKRKQHTQQQSQPKQPPQSPPQDGKNPKSPLITLDGITKKYGQLTAVDQVSLQIHEGEIFGILGPNGAGKTSIIEMMEGLRTPDAGEILVSGFSSLRGNRDYHKIIGVQLQNSAINENLQVAEILQLFALFHGLPVAPARQMLETVGLQAKSRQVYRSLSGGEARQVQLILTFFHKPKIVFLDEPTTGLDPVARRQFWQLLQANKERGQTIILTTHYVEEAEALCNRVAFIAQGRIVKMGTPQELIAGLGQPYKITFDSDQSQSSDFTKLAAIPGVLKLETLASGVVLYTKNELATLKALLEFMEQQRITTSHLAVQKSKLEDVYISLVSGASHD